MNNKKTKHFITVNNKQYPYVMWPYEDEIFEDGM